ncbi:hypothetical protein GETHOR_23510 [Geothrix oryzae]|uniref:HNH domain-containing protein n=1 Tax=Geothrix oryzae TaxID=2927975 RepID=A0ABM8DT90_9BACT|nr:HNH endonuclease [Geothrix oryzae]BDU70250.1 hypothetical protein GETHOR_23510 [Geothrix oryzae]
MLPAFHSVSGVFIEFTKTEHEHGGPGWEFGTCLWSPTVNNRGANSYALMSAPEKGDLVLHFLLTKWPDGTEETRVAGFSYVAKPCQTVQTEPTKADKWANRGSYFRIDLKGYTPFPNPLPMKTLIEEYGEDIRKELIENGPRFYPFNRYGAGLHTVQGIYLGRCTENLYQILAKAMSIEVATTAAKAEPGPEHREYAEARRLSSERYFFARNPSLRKDAIQVYGTSCQACGFDFGARYGAHGAGYIEVHHKDPLSERAEAEWTEEVRTALSQVAVLCANCHRMVHRKKQALTIEQLKDQLQNPPVSS